eukprot:NODE_2515_length_2198_cov_26.004829.p1 GENE.NODE_2515_length_2198_cov_26.004829~~NODE_2515_length_2198_cov_26.004829.p1  ORF type:complete len:605 (-),score=167.51 NODE_2515_length_2198_cov_26.004829:233-2047(-)
MEIGRCYVAGRADQFAQRLDFGEAVGLAAKDRLVVFGEPWYGCPSAKQKMIPVMAFEIALIERSMASCSGAVHVVHELLMLDGQALIDRFMAGEMNFDAFAEVAIEGGMQKALAMYKPVFEFMQANAKRIRLWAGNVPGSVARAAWKESLEAALGTAVARDWVAADETCQGSDEYYNFFESLLTQRNMFDAEKPPIDRYRNMFPAQVIKAVAVAWAATKLHAIGNPEEKIVVLCSAGNMEYSYGVVERVAARSPGLVFSRVSSVNYDKLGAGNDKDDTIFGECLRAHYGGVDKNVADFVFAYEELGEMAAAPAYPTGTGQSTVDGDAVKLDVAQRYNTVSGVAHIQGNVELARRNLERCGYTASQMEVAGADASNWQGVNNPHNFIAIREGSHVLDVGSGLGIDSFIAAAAVGPTGTVTGLDIAHGEVRHANERAEKRGISSYVKFVCGDCEKMPFPEATFDALISNGAVCLAPDKPQSFREFYRVLRPGGHFSVATFTLRRRLDGGVSWPICMQMFAHLDQVMPMLNDVGFVDVAIDMSRSLIDVELDEAEKELREKVKDTPEYAQRRAANTIHVKAEEFKHLQDFNMNEICARIVAHGRKPE